MKQRCVVWGTRAAGQELARQAVEMGCEVAAYCSGTKTSQGKKIGRLPVISPEELRQLYREKEIDSILLGVRNPNYLIEIEEAVSHLPPLDMKTIFADTSRIENAYLKTVRERLRYQWNITFEEQAGLWLQNFMGEVESWVKDDAEPAGVYHSVYMDRLKNTDFLGLDPACRELVPNLDADSIVMDIGCGLASKYGTRLPNSKHIRLLAVDPLAPFYNRINQKYAGGMGRTCEFGMFEFIANFYEENHCDVILINNALDHCIDPFKSIVECLYILKRGGSMRLNHRRAEALYEAYQGLHKWNIDHDGQGNLVFWNQENAANISQRLREVADIRLHCTDEQCNRGSQMIIADIIKKRDFQLEEFLDMAQERRQLAFLTKGLMEHIADCYENTDLKIPPNP